MKRPRRSFVNQQIQNVSKAQDLYYNLAASKHKLNNCYQQLHATWDAQLVKIKKADTVDPQMSPQNIRMDINQQYQT